MFENDTSSLYKAFNCLMRDIESFLGQRGIKAKTYFNAGFIMPDMVSQIENDGCDVSLVLVTDHNGIPVETSSGDISPAYDEMRIHLNKIAANKKVVLITGHRDDDVEGTPTPNIHRIWFPYVGMLEDMDGYQAVDIVREKNFSSTKHWVSLNRCHNHHRVMTAMILLGQGLGLDLDEKKHTGRLHISPAPLQGVRDWKQFWGNTYHQVLDPSQEKILDQGFKRLRNGMNGGQPDGSVISDTVRLRSNSVNFDKRLRYMYQDSVIEIINGTTFYNPAGYSYCEKVLNSILGMNLPLFSGNRGMVHGMRLMGFDVFDDIIDHSYDVVEDPIQRMFALVQSNLRLLQDRDVARACWVKALPRLLANVEVARDMLPRATRSVLADLDSVIQGHSE